MSNKVNVAEALANGNIRVIPRLQDLEESIEAIDEEIEGIDLISRRSILDDCNVCLEEHMHGFALACEHSMCISWMRELFVTAVRDSSLLPLRCCKAPIDMNMPSPYVH